jgi:competence protein ComEC
MNLAPGLLAALALLAPGTPAPPSAFDFQGLESDTLPPVLDAPGEWGLKIVVFDVGQADAIALLAPNGDVALVDTGKTNDHGEMLADFLGSEAENGVGALTTVDVLYTTHYDKDHIGGIKALTGRGIRIRKALDQGLSLRRHEKQAYTKYVVAVGDANDNYFQDPDERDFVRHVIHHGHVELLGEEDSVEVRCVSVRGDTKGSDHDEDHDPSADEINENPGSVALVVRLGEFEFYSAGDQTGDDWKNEPDIEERLVAAGAIPDGNDIDVMKVNHHGSDTSSSAALVQALDPEVAVISTTHTQNRLPKRIALKQYEENDCYVLVTGDGHDPTTGLFPDAKVTDDDGYVASTEAVFNAQGSVTILVSVDGARYTVRGAGFDKTFSSADADNPHP